MTEKNYIGYHGTNSQSVDSIKATNFKPSLNDDDWLGHGIYFFIDGINCPILNACEWAKNQAYQNGYYTYHEYSVLKVNIKCLRVLDASERKGMNAFNKLKEVIIKKNPQIFKKYRKSNQDNRQIWNLVAKQMNLDVVINSLFIQHKEERIKKISSNVPNSLVLCVKNNKIIDINKLEIIQNKRKVK